MLDLRIHLVSLVLTAAVPPAVFAQEPPLPPEAPVELVANPDGTFYAVGPRHRAAFGAAGATLHAPDPNAAGSERTLRLRLTDWGRDGDRRPVAAAAARRAGARTVHFEHGGIVERYRSTRNGFEQSFVLDQRPAGRGDLMLGITVDAPQLTAPATGARHQALEFRAPTGAAIRYGEAFAFGRGAAPIAIATRYDGAGRIELIVPADLLERATFPLTIDPTVGPTLEPSGQLSDDTNADVAYDPVHEVFCVVWQRRINVNDSRIRALRYDRDGNQIGSVTTVTGAGFATWPTIAHVQTGTQNGFFVAWSDSGGLRGRFLDAQTGALQGTTQQLTTVPLGVRDLRPALSVGGGGWALAWDRTPTGTANPTEILMRRVQPGNSTSVAVTLGNEFQIEPTTSGYVRRARIPRRHIYQGVPVIRICWERFYPSPSPGDTDLRMAVVALGMTSQTFSENPNTVPGAGTIGVDEANHDIASLDDAVFANYLLAWDEGGDVKGLRYDLNGLNGSEFTIRATADSETAPAVGGGSCEFTVAYLRQTQGTLFENEVVAARVRADGSVMTTDVPVQAVAGSLYADLRASSVPLSTNPNEPNTVMLSWLHASSTIGVQKDIQARLFEPVGVTASPFGSACPGPGGTVPAIGLAGRPYAGNAGFGVELDNAPPNSLVALLASDQLTSTAIPGAPGCTLYAGLPLLNAFVTISDGAGNATVGLPIPCGVPHGFALALQWAVYTPGHNPFGWIASDDIDLYWSH